MMNNEKKDDMEIASSCSILSDEFTLDEVGSFDEDDYNYSTKSEAEIKIMLINTGELMSIMIFDILTKLLPNRGMVRVRAIFSFSLRSIITLVHIDRRACTLRTSTLIVQ